MRASQWMRHAWPAKQATSTTPPLHSSPPLLAPPVPAGKDATEEFEEIGHSRAAKEMLGKYYIGEFAEEEEVQHTWSWGSWGSIL